MIGIILYGSRLLDMMKLKFNGADLASIHDNHYCLQNILHG